MLMVPQLRWMHACCCRQDRCSCLMAAHVAWSPGMCWWQLLRVLVICCGCPWRRGPQVPPLGAASAAARSCRVCCHRQSWCCCTLLRHMLSPHPWPACSISSTDAYARLASMLDLNSAQLSLGASSAFRQWSSIGCAAGLNGIIRCTTSCSRSWACHGSLACKHCWVSCYADGTGRHQLVWSLCYLAWKATSCSACLSCCTTLHS